METTGTHQALDPTDERWVEFACSCPQANVFYHPAWIEMLSACYGYPALILAVFSQDGWIRAGLPLMKVNSPLTGRRWVALPFTDYCGPLYREEADLYELAGWLVQLYELGETSRIEIRAAMPAWTSFQAHCDFVLHTIELCPKIDLVSKRFKRTHLQNIRNAEARGVQVVRADCLEQMWVFYNLQLETRKRHGVPVQPKRFFELLWRYVISAGLGQILLAHKDGEYLAGMVYLHWNHSLIAKYAASREDRLNLRPNNLLFWEGMRWGCENGYTLFDMGRTEIANEGLRTFKNRWGSQEQQLVYSTLAATTLRTEANRFSDMLHRLIQRSPDWVCRASGELLYRHFG